MEGNGKFLTIPEAATLAGRSVSSIYNYINSGGLKVEQVVLKGKKSKRIKKSVLASFFGISNSNLEQVSPSLEQQIPELDQNILSLEQVSPSLEQIRPSIDYDRLRDNMKDIVEEVLESKQTQLMQPLEKQAMFLAGKYESENKFLKERLETVIEENETLRSQMRALPGPVEEITEKLQQLEQQEAVILSLEEEKQSIQQEATEALQKLQAEKESALEEKEKLLSQKEIAVQELQKQTEDLLAAKDRETAELKEQFEKQTEEIAAAWKKELEAELNRPWWKRIFR